MPSNKHKKAHPDLGKILEGLVDAGIDFILVGGLAEVAQGAPITTMDVDIVHRRTDENIEKLIKFLRSIGAHYRRLDDNIIEPTPAHLSGEGHSLFDTVLGPLDILGTIEEGYTYEKLLPYTVELKFRGRKIKVLSLSKIVELKRSPNAPRDPHRLAILEETIRQSEENPKK